MGKMDLLNANISGTVGAMTGQVYKGKSVLHARIWSRTPLNRTQKNSVRAFEALNRLSCAISKHWFYWLGIRADNMLKHNAVAHFLQPVVADHTFNTAVLPELFPDSSSVALGEVQYNPETGKLDFSASYIGAVPLGNSASWLVLVFDQAGHVFYSEAPAESSISRSFIISGAPAQQPDILILSSVKSNGKFLLGMAQGLPLVVGSIFYTSRSQGSVWRFVSPSVAQATGSGVSVSGKVVAVLS